jgi:RNA polymerase sigma-70 factor (ECF subfamily)
MDGDRARTNAELKRQLDARFRRPLMSFFSRRVRNRAEAEDLTQEVFVRLLGSASVGDVVHADAFVFKIAANLLRDRGRKAARWRFMESAPVDDESLIHELTQDLVEDRGPERVLLGREQLAAALKALDELGERTKSMFVLFRLEHMKQRDIAALYGVSESTVEKQIMKATLHLAWRCGPKL